MKPLFYDLSLFSKSGTHSPGDWGTKSLKCFFGGMTSDPMLALPPIPLLKNIKTHANNQTNQEKNMHNSNYKSDHGVSHKPFIPNFISIPLVFVFITGCSLQVHKRDLIQNVLNRQIDLIEKLENERRDQKVESKLKRDESLWKAEKHLLEAIRAIKNANEAIKKTL